MEGLRAVLEDEMLTIDDLAKYLKLKPQTIYKWAQAGKIPGAKFGKEWRFRRSAIEQWIDSNMQASCGKKQARVEAVASGVGSESARAASEAAEQRSARPAAHRSVPAGGGAGARAPDGEPVGAVAPGARGVGAAARGSGTPELAPSATDLSALKRGSKGSRRGRGPSSN